MFWLRLFWFEALAVPAYMLYRLLSTPAPSPYRVLNLVVWSSVLIAAVAVLLRGRRQRREGSEERA